MNVRLGAVVLAGVTSVIVVSSAQTGIFITGRVVSAVTGQPIVGARVGSNVADTVLGAATDTQGNFRLDTHGAGRFVVRATAPGYATSTYGEEAGLGPLIISTAVDRGATGIDFSLQRGATIAGRVIDDAKEPLVNIRVNASTERWMFGERQLLSVASAQTNDRGEFRIIGLAPGEYVVAVHDRGSVTFAPSTTSLKSARRIKVDVGQESAETLIQSRAGASGSIQGQVLGAAVTPASRIFLRPESTDTLPTDLSTNLRAGGQFLFDNVAPGRYWLIVRPGLAPAMSKSWAQDPVVVNAGGDVKHDVALKEGATITGTVTPGAEIALTPFEVTGSLVTAPIRIRPGSAVPFRLSGIAPGRYRFQRTQESIFHLTILEGKSPIDLADQVFTVAAGETRELSVERIPGGGASIGGTVTDRDGKATTAGGVIIAASDSRYWTGVSRRLVLARADQLGYYEAARLPAGEYLVMHVPQIAPGQLWDTAFLKKTLAGAQRVTLAVNDKQVIDVRLK